MRFFPALLLLLLACWRPSADQLEEQILTKMRTGQPEQARDIARKGVARFGAAEDLALFHSFRLYEIELQIRLGHAEQARSLLAALPRAFADQPDLEARRALWQGFLIRRENPVETRQLWEKAYQQATLARASRTLLQTCLLLSRQISQNEPLRAEALCRQAAELAQQTGDIGNLAGALNVLGVQLLQQFRYDEAIQVLTSAPIDHPDAARHRGDMLTNLGLCYSRLGHYQTGMKYLQQAIDHYRNVKSPSLGYALGEMGNNYYFRGNYSKAFEYYHQAYTVLETKYGDAASIWAGNMAAVLIRQKAWNEADRWNQTARGLTVDAKTRSHLALNGAEIADGIGQPQEAIAIYNDILAREGIQPEVIWAVHAGLGDLYNRQGDWEAARQHFLAATDQILEVTDLPEIADRIAYYGRMNRFYESYVDALAKRGETLNALEVVARSRARILAERHSESLKQAHFSVEELTREARKSNRYFVSFWTAAKRSFVWVIGPDAVKMEVLPPRDLIEEHLDQYQSLVIGGADPYLHDKNGAGVWLYKKLIEPIDEVLPDGAMVVLSAGNLLARLNPETLCTPNGYWLEKVVLTQTASLALIGASNIQTPIRRLFIMGDPVEASRDFPPLMHGAREIESLESWFENRDLTIVRENQAWPQQYRRSEPQNYDLICFVAHAEANPAEPLHSSIILSPSPEGGPFMLTAREIMDIPISAQLVTLSACYSAGSRAYAGEGLVGFAWAFLHAGAHNVLAGLWDVDDGATADLMSHFHEELAAGGSPALALRKAKLALVRSEKVLGKPYYWGGFQIYTR